MNKKEEEKVKKTKVSEDKTKKSKKQEAKVQAAKPKNEETKGKDNKVQNNATDKAKEKKWTQEDEAEFAADFLESVLDASDLGGDIQMSVKNDRILIEIVNDEADELDVLIGENEKTLNALQFLTRLAVQRKTHEKSTLVLDIKDHRSEKQNLILKTLGSIEKFFNAKKKEFKSSGLLAQNVDDETFKFEPANSFERKMVHDWAKEKKYFTQTKGEKNQRYTIISSVEISIEAPKEKHDKDNKVVNKTSKTSKSKENASNEKEKTPKKKK